MTILNFCTNLVQKCNLLKISTLKNCTKLVQNIRIKDALPTQEQLRERMRLLQKEMLITGSVLLIIFQDKQSTKGNTNETSNELQ